MSVYDKKIGEIIPKEEFGNLSDLFVGEVKLVKISYTVQDENGFTMDAVLTHEDYIEKKRIKVKMITNLIEDGVDLFKERKIKKIGEVSMMGQIFQVDKDVVRIFSKPGRTLITCTCCNDTRYCNESPICKHKISVLYSLMPDKINMSLKFIGDAVIERDKKINSLELEMRYLKQKLKECDNGLAKP